MKNSKKKKNRHNPKLLVVTSTYPRWKEDNIPSFVEELCVSFTEKFDEVTVIAPHFKGAKSQEKTRQNLTIRRFHYFIPESKQDIVYLGSAATKFNTSILYLAKLAGFIFFELVYIFIFSVRKNTIVNAHWLIPQGVLAVFSSKITGKRTVITIHGSDVFALNSRFLNWTKKYALKNADAVVVNSSATKEACERIWNKRNYPIIPMGVNASLFKPANKKKKEYFSILFVGRLSPEKGCIYACKAVMKLLEKRNKVVLEIIGDGTERSSLENFVKRNGLQDNIKFLGWIQKNKLSDYYQQADLVIGTSIEHKGQQEGLGLVFIEAMMCGVPVVAFDVGGVSDIVKDKINGYLLPEKNIDLLVEKIEFLYNNPTALERLKSNSFQSVREKYSWDIVSHSYHKILTGEMS